MGICRRVPTFLMTLVSSNGNLLSPVLRGRAKGKTRMTWKVSLIIRPWVKLNPLQWRSVDPIMRYDSVFRAQENAHRRIGFGQAYAIPACVRDWRVNCLLLALTCTLHVEHSRCPICINEKMFNS